MALRGRERAPGTGRGAQDSLSATHTEHASAAVTTESPRTVAAFPLTSDLCGNSVSTATAELRNTGNKNSVTSSSKHKLLLESSANVGQPVAGPVAHNGKHSPRTYQTPLLPAHSVLPKVGEVSEEVEDYSDVSAGSSSGNTTSTFSAPVPPVPSDMAEAIKRQQKGAGSVRYWKTKHLQSGRGHHLSLKGGNSSFQNAMFPMLKTPTLHNGQSNGGGVVVNGNVSSSSDNRLSKAKDRLIRQRTREHELAELRRSISSNTHYPQYHTQYMYGHPLGYPPPPPAYKRSVTTVQSVLSLPLPLSCLHPAKLTLQSSPNPHPYLTQPPESSPRSSLTQPPESSPRSSLTQPPGPTPHSALTPTPPSQPPQAAPAEESPGDGVQSHQLLEVLPKSPSMDTDLTCLQLADAILGTKPADLNRIYEICQTKIRYVDFLERSPTFRAHELACHSSRAQKMDRTNPVRQYTTPRLNTWIPSMDSKSGGTSSVFDRRKEEGEASLSPRDSKPSLFLPSLVGSGNGLKLNLGHPSSSSKSYLQTSLHDDEVTSPPPLVPAVPLGKPILKPFNPDSISLKVQRHYDPFSPRSVYSDLTGTTYEGTLSVRGTTMYPLNTDEGQLEDVRQASRRSQSSKSRKEAELRKRAVRFSIADQVYEFAPGEPVSP